MSSNSRHEGLRPIAGEPANEQSSKNIPPLNAHRQNQQTTAQSTVKKKKKLLQAIQIISIITALILSAYCFTVIDSLEESNGKSGTDGMEVLVRTEGRESDGICSDGGADIFIGNDNNRNGILEENEVTSTTRLCHGQEGLSGPQGATGPNGTPGIESLVNTSIVESGNETCLYGGLMVTSGLDSNANGTLEENEIIAMEYVCNGLIGNNGIDGSDGVRGHSALVEKVDPPLYLCPSGLVINFAIDNGAGNGFADDGLIHDNEIIDSLKICSQPLNHGPISDLFTGVSDSFSSQCDEFVWSNQQKLLAASGSDSLSGCELWLSSGTLATTQKLLDINSGSGDSSPGLYLGLNLLEREGGELLLFDADSGANGRELWVSDFTSTGTVQLTGYSGDGVTADSKAELWMGGLVFTDSNGKFMWTNGTIITELFDSPFIDQTNQAILDSLAEEISSHSQTSMSSDNDGLWFSAVRLGMGYEMHHLSNSGTLTSWDLNNFEDSTPDAILPMNDIAVVVADDGINGRQLVELNLSGQHNWLTSMTLQSNGNPTTNVAQGLGLNLLGDKIIFDAQTSAVDPTVWSYNLTTEIANELSQQVIAPGSRTNPVISNNRLWFDCTTATTASELCVSDGTSSGTKMIYEFQPGMTSSEIRNIVTFQNQIILLVNGEIDGFDTGHCLWSLDASTLEASLLHDPWSGLGNNSNAGSYGELAITSDFVIFIADDGQSGHELQLYSPLMLNDEWLIWN